MILYEVNLEVDADAAQEYLAWLEPHIREIAALPGFRGAELFERGDTDGAAQRHFCVQYRLDTAADLERYFAEQAPRLRADGEARFGGRFRATRRILTLRTKT